MAFNFNWSPLIADTSRARDMLTTALNKSPKPPIIVDDILVTELNLGSIPPELEILEIGDLAEDRFRGIFKMTYVGDAFLTLKTKVQANPLNTYLSTKPSFASPQPLAASSGLTIPLQITLSDIKLSGFVILVFSRQKGITLVFRNDPLESLKVSSTFDSIPFVRDYLQKEIEAQLRVLFMDDLPAIIHRLSLRLWVPEHAPPDAEVTGNTNDDTERPVNPLATPSQKPQDAFGRPLEDDDFSLSNEGVSETYASFSQKNLLRLAALTDSHRTLSLFTPPIPDAVFRARAGAAEKSDMSGSTTPGTRVAISRRQSSASSVCSVGSAASNPSTAETVSTASSSTRPALSTTSSTYSVLSTRSKAHNGQRRRKKRVVDLRRPSTVAEAPESTTPSATQDPSASPTPRAVSSLQRLREGEMETPPETPEKAQPQPQQQAWQQHDAPRSLHAPRPIPLPLPLRPTHRPAAPGAHGRASTSKHDADAVSHTETAGGILEQAWMRKMASEISRKVREERARGEGTGLEAGFELPPPAYAA